MKRAKTRVTIKLSFDLPTGATAQHAIMFVRESIGYYIGCVSAGHIMAPLNRETITASLMKKETTYG